MARGLELSDMASKTNYVALKTVEQATKNSEHPVEATGPTKQQTDRVKMASDGQIMIRATQSINPGWGSGLTPEVVQFMVGVITPYLTYRWNKRSEVQPKGQKSDVKAEIESRSDGPDVMSKMAHMTGKSDVVPTTNHNLDSPDVMSKLTHIVGVSDAIEDDLSTSERVCRGRTTQRTGPDEIDIDSAITGRFTLAEMREKQDRDTDIHEFKELLMNSPVKPRGSEMTQYSPAVKNYWNQWGRMTLKEGVLYRKPKGATERGNPHQYVAPDEVRKDFYKQLHHARLAGHQGVNRTLMALQLRFYWPNMRGDVTTWCQQCKTCGVAKALPIRRKSPLQQRLTGGPFERVGIDLMGPFETTSNTNQYIVVMQDYFTKWVIAEALPDKSTMGVADVVYMRWIAQYGCPMQIHSDQGGEFTSHLIRELCAALRIEKTVTTAYRPQSDGMVERANRTIQNMLKAYVNANRDDWDDHLASVLCAYRATPHDSTGVTPFKMLHGREMTLPIDLQFDLGERIEMPICAVEYVEWAKESLRKSHEFARKQLKVSAKRQKKNYQEKSRDAVFKRGDWTWKVDPVRRPGKLHPKNTGPWLVLLRVSEVIYKVQRLPDADPKLVHVDKLSKYYPEDGEQLKSWIPLTEKHKHISTQTEEINNPLIPSPREDSVNEDPVSNQVDGPVIEAAEGPSAVPPARGTRPGTRHSSRARGSPDRYVAAVEEADERAPRGHGLTCETVALLIKALQKKGEIKAAIIHETN